MTKEQSKPRQFVNRAFSTARTPQLPSPDALAGEALGFIAADPERLGDFLSVTGLDGATLRDAAAEPGFGRGVLAFIAADEALLLGLAADKGWAPEHLGQAIARATRANEAFDAG